LISKRLRPSKTVLNDQHLLRLEVPSQNSQAFRTEVPVLEIPGEIQRQIKSEPEPKTAVEAVAGLVVDRRLAMIHIGAAIDPAIDL